MILWHDFSLSDQSKQGQTRTILCCHFRSVQSVCPSASLSSRSTSSRSLPSAAREWQPAHPRRKARAKGAGSRGRLPTISEIRHVEALNLEPGWRYAELGSRAAGQPRHRTIQAETRRQLLERSQRLPMVPPVHVVSREVLTVRWLDTQSVQADIDSDSSGRDIDIQDHVPASQAGTQPLQPVMIRIERDKTLQ